MDHTEPHEIGVGVLGFGTVGTGVVDGLHRRGERIAARTGIRLALRGVADLDLERDRGVPVDPALLTRDAAALVDDPGVDVVAELIGGTGAARELALRALALGKPVVTANKALLAVHGAELFEAARRHHTGLFFEASVGGGVPIVRALQEGLVSNRFHHVCGILNGTCNYILTRMEAEAAPFDAVLAEAQREGFAEADPALDIDGHDTAHKACILATLAHGGVVPIDAVPVTGIRGISPLDLAYAAGLGYRIKLLAFIRRGGDAVEVGVGPTLVPRNHMLASVQGVFNAVLVAGDQVGDTLYYGRGAGRDATASAVLADLADAASRRITQGPWMNGCFRADPSLRLRDPGDVRARYYLRLTLQDRPGILARVAGILGEHGISIAAVVQKASDREAPVPVVVLTHEASARALRAALRAIDALDCVGAPTVRFTIEDFAPPAG